MNLHQPNQLANHPSLLNHPFSVPLPLLISFPLDPDLVPSDLFADDKLMNLTIVDINSKEINLKVSYCSYSLGSYSFIFRWSNTKWY